LALRSNDYDFRIAVNQPGLQSLLGNSELNGMNAKACSTDILDRVRSCARFAVGRAAPAF
jgi:hypothetical protein